MVHCHLPEPQSGVEHVRAGNVYYCSSVSPCMSTIMMESYKSSNGVILLNLNGFSLNGPT